MSSGKKVNSILAGCHVDAPPPSRSRGSFDVTILDRDGEGRMARMRIASLGGDVEYDVLATHRDSQGRLVQLRITKI